MKLAAFYPGALFYRLRYLLFVALVSTSRGCEWWIAVSAQDMYCGLFTFIACEASRLLSVSFKTEGEWEPLGFQQHKTNDTSQVHYICDCKEAEANILFYLRLLLLLLLNLITMYFIFLIIFCNHWQTNEKEAKQILTLY